MHPTNTLQRNEKYDEFGYDSIVSVFRSHLFRWQEVPPGERTRALTHDPDNKPRREDWDGELYENGAMYITRADLVKKGIRLGGKIGYYEMPAHSFGDIHTPEDWSLAEDRVLKHGYVPDSLGHEKKYQIKLLVCHADGTLTDGRAFTGLQQMLPSNNRDSVAMREMMKMGVDVRIVSSSDAPAHVQMAKLIGCTIAMGCTDAFTQLDEWRQELDLDWTQVIVYGIVVFHARSRAGCR